MKSPIRGLLAGALMAWAALAAEAAPNIVFILVDDMGWGDLGVFFQNSRGFETHRNMPAFATPNLDAIAAQGLQLRRHYCSAPVCAPARASLLLGVHQGHSNVRDNQFTTIENNHTLASVLRRAGFHRAHGEMGLQGGAFRRTRGVGALTISSATYSSTAIPYPREGRRLGRFHQQHLQPVGPCYTTDWTARLKMDRGPPDIGCQPAVLPVFLRLATRSCKVPDRVSRGRRLERRRPRTGTPGLRSIPPPERSIPDPPRLHQRDLNSDNNAATLEVSGPPRPNATPP